MLVVAALGGNALLRRGEPADDEHQRHNVETDVPYVERHHATERAQPIREASVRELDPAEFDGGSMRPKIEAACRFVTETGGIAAIGALSDAAAILAGEAGTRIVAASVQAPRAERASHP